MHAVLHKAALIVVLQPIEIYLYMYMFQFVDAHLSKRILHEAHRQQQEIENDAGISSSASKKKVTKLEDASDDDSADEAELQDDMDGDYYENIVRI
jgi:hypothetical protein